MQNYITILMCMIIISSALLLWSLLYAIKQYKHRTKDWHALTHHVSSIVGTTVATIVSGVFFLIVVLMDEEELYPALLLFLPAFLYSGYAFLSTVNCRVEVCDDYLLYQNAFRIVKRIPYEKIESFRIYVSVRTHLAQKYEICATNTKIKIHVLSGLYHFRNFKNYLIERLVHHDSGTEIEQVVIG